MKKLNNTKLEEKLNIKLIKKALLESKIVIEGISNCSCLVSVLDALEEIKWYTSKLKPKKKVSKKTRSKKIK